MLNLDHYGRSEIYTCRDLHNTFVKNLKQTIMGGNYKLRQIKFRKKFKVKVFKSFKLVTYLGKHRLNIYTSPHKGKVFKMTRTN